MRRATPGHKSIPELDVNHELNVPQPRMRLLPFLQAPLPSCLSFLDRPTAGWSCTDLRGCGLDHLQLRRLLLLFDQHGLRTHFICHDPPPLFHGPRYTKLIPSSPSDSVQSTRERSSH